tara:strand:+ start:352 stop:576 length:225 start_codon:yes stop_codon:yes gene_type:complete
MVDNQTQAAAAAQLIETWTEQQVEADYYQGKCDGLMTWADAVSLVDIACQFASKNGFDEQQLRMAMRVITKGCH